MTPEKTTELTKALVAALGEVVENTPRPLQTEKAEAIVAETLRKAALHSGFDLCACLVCAVEYAEGRETELTKNWIRNAKDAITKYERSVGVSEACRMYPEAANDA